ncbi:beta-L-arabinofuranosidase domain-containing protein [Arthrobacter sp. Cr_A7]|uniref:beta-L-arabinofuranosidase domain-containing protein n=1 Tax=Arthrobacter sp. Cr_A7 TaxID=3031017 RepID=UPI0023DC4E0E|nr:beta-L-arabinofuranosidase domain-containing protein [Arthrobacter sp. Cr_A7]MDF2051870.1 glycoside hydrolase family 127 protein [Arthrobacter sp. Cr_A7]
MTVTASKRSGPVSFPLHTVRLLEGAFKDAQDTSLRYILSLDVDRLCAPYLGEAGLVSAAKPYGSWESDGMGGHIGGHYLSGCARLFAATGHAGLLAQMETVVGILGTCQDAGGDGFVGGVPGGRDLGRQLKAGDVDADLFTLNGRWVPLYNLHKTLAGLLDAHVFAGSNQALAIAAGLADWWLGISTRLRVDVFEAVLHTEFGGMNDAFAILWQLTGREEYLREARRFSHRGVLEPLAAGRDQLDGLHANTQIPKVVGYARLAAETGDPGFSRASNTFWESVVSRRSVSIGGNSVREHFHPSSDFTPMVLDAQGPETCNTYNMLKLAKLRFEAFGDPAALDFYERATYNHILSSQHPASGGLVYFTPMRPGHYRVYSRAQESMWCCVGSGLENHARYGELIYSHDADGLLVNLYIPSALDWAEKGLQVRLDTAFPHSDLVTLHISASAPVQATIRLRRPGWAADMAVDGGGEAGGSVTDDGGGYVSISRIWHGTATVRIRLAPELRSETLPDGSPWVSFLYGPVVLAARAGSEGVPGFEARDERMAHVAAGELLPLAQTPVVPDGAAVRLLDRAALTVQLPVVDAAGKSGTVVLEPFSGIHDERYTVYWPAGDPAGRRAELRGLDQLAAAQGQVLDAVAAGEQQPESDHGFAGEATRAGGDEGIHWRSATGWFSYVLKDPDRRAQVLRVRFRQVPGRGHELRLDGVLLDKPANEWQEGDQVVADYALPESREGQTRDGRFVFAVHALPGCSTGDLLSVQLLRTS